MRWILLNLLMTGVALAQQPKAPRQPELGPGGKTANHAAVKASVYGIDASQFWIFEPDQPAPGRNGAGIPVIVFIHGWNATHPQIYGAWVEHIVRRGNIVIWPRYQKDYTTPPPQFTPNALDAVKRAFAELEHEVHAKPDRNRFAIAGHSVGGLLTANLASIATANGLPEPRAMMPVQPGISSTGVRDWPGVPLESFAGMPKTAQMIVVVGDQDRLVGQNDGKRIHRFSPLPAERKHFFVMQSDQHGLPGLIADHLSPLAYGSMGLSNETLSKAIEPALPRGVPGVGGGGGAATSLRSALLGTAGLMTVNALDHHGYWRLFDELTDAAFDGRRWEPNASMGQWSDGVPVTPLQSPR